MFSKLKQIKELRDQAKKIQNALATESVTVEKNGVEIIMNGNMEISSVRIKEILNNEKMENTIKDVINDAIKKTQKIMASKMRDMGGLPGLN